MIRVLLFLAISLFSAMAHAGVIDRLDAELRAAGIPITGVSATGTTRAGIIVSFAPEATTQQKAQAATIVQNFDLTAKPRPTKEEIVTKWNSLTSTQRNNALAQIIAYLIQNDPNILKELGYEAD